MKKWLAILVSLMLLVMAGTASAEITLRFGDPEVPNTGAYDAHVKFIELVKEKTNGEVIIEHYHSGQLGSDKQVMQAVMTNTLDIGKISTGNLSEFSSIMDFCDFPGMFLNADHVYKVLASPIRDELTKKLYDELGAYPIAYDVDGGAARIMLNVVREVKLPGDLAGLKIRTTGSDIEIALYDAWDVGATPMAWQELYTGLSQKVVDGVYAGPVPAHTNKFTEVAKYATLLNLSFGPSVRVLSQGAIDKLGGLDSDLFKAVQEAARECELVKRELQEAEIAKTIDDMRAIGVNVYVPTAEEEIIWQQSAFPLVEKFVGDGKAISQELYDSVQALLNE